MPFRLLVRNDSASDLETTIRFYWPPMWDGVRLFVRNDSASDLTTTIRFFIGPRCGMARKIMAPDVELAPVVGNGPRLGTNP